MVWVSRVDFRALPSMPSIFWRTAVAPSPVVELHADALLAIALGEPAGVIQTTRPDIGNLLGIIHQGQQHVDLIAHLVGPVGRNEQAATLDVCGM
jgi:hypothetical protein